MAELLSATERVDVTYYNKLRFELVEEYGLPPPGDGAENVQVCDRYIFA